MNLTVATYLLGILVGKKVLSNVVSKPAHDCRLVEFDRHGVLDNGPFGKREATQDDFLYDDRWTKEVDNLFIDLLVEAHFGLQWRHGRPGSNVFAYFRGVLVADLRANFTVTEVKERFDFLHKRFRVFSWMLRKHGLRLCVQSNVLTAPIAVWDDIFESDPFSVAYQHSEDPRWLDIRYLFTEVYEASSNASNVLDQNSTNENYVAALYEQSYVFELSSLTNDPLLNSSIGNNVCQPRSTRERQDSSEGSVNTHTHVNIQRRGSRTPLRIPRPPRKPAPSSCKGSSSDPPT
ncbi:NADH-dependent glutamate synthase 1 [Striga asiatica]|uniref:NADH-dependent glutamate synthase 1 n=1 Tax=Striga asiatica TaxID=4170 RepID=A0A5A7R093_STRAF|nr:NADH-dependent glutamate synthase 1 [Striga asiatica]